MFIILMYHIKCLIHTLWNFETQTAYHLESHYKVNLEPDSCRRRIPKFEALHWIGFGMHELITNEIELRRDE